MIYMHVSRITGKKYIGLTSRSWEQRWQEHIALAKTSDSHFHRAIAAYGENDWDHIILTTIETCEQALESERQFILEHRSFEPEVGYNLTMGGDGCLATLETRLKLSKSLKGNEKLRASLRNREFSDEHRQNIGKFHLGRKRSKETRQRLSDSHKKPRKPQSEDTKRKLSEALKRSWERRRSEKN